MSTVRYLLSETCREQDKTRWGIIAMYSNLQQTEDPLMIVCDEVPDELSVTLSVTFSYKILH